jgi:flavin-dependent dehydrogenase
MSAPDCQVAIVGGGPGGATVAGFLARAGLSVVLFERETFPRFHVGESLLPATLPILDRLGALDAVTRRGFQVKYGAVFSDQEMDLEQRYYFLRDRPWPHYSFQVPRAEFDTILLEHARATGVDVRQPATVERIALERDGVTLAGVAAGTRFTTRATFLVDATGRDALVASRVGRRDRVPNLGKVALFAHFRGAERASGIDEGSIRIHVFPDGWFWWIPFAGDTTSVGCVMHARTAREWHGELDELLDAMVSRCWRVAKGLEGAERVTPVHRAANFAYVNHPAVGDRFVAVGDAIAFVDPIFSGGVHIAMSSGELAARAIAGAFRDGRFEARRFRAYERAVWRGVEPFFRFIRKYYEPAFLELFLKPRNRLGMFDAVLSVLAGGAFGGLPVRTRLSLEALFALVRVNVWLRRRAGLPVESRLEW